MSSIELVNENISPSFFDNIVKPSLDKRLYRGVQLPNGLKVVLISDPTTDKSAASLDVYAGSLVDPVEIPGLAHFLEHMLFLGTEKYPEDNAYFKFISGHGGSANAYTAPTNTNYHFDVSPLHLDGALDRFSQFFIAPLLNESATERELNIVHCEHEKNLKSDVHRNHQINLATAMSGHDFGKFATGNRETLKTIPEEKGIAVREALLNLHSQWYSANIMSLAVLGRETLDELYEMVVKKFSLIENKNVKIKKYDTGPYGVNELKKKITIVPIKESRRLCLVFPIPDMHEHYKSQPGHYLSHLIGHEGEGSLLAQLKRLGLVNTLCSSCYRYADGFGFFDITMDVTEEGLNEIDKIVEHIFQYVSMIKHDGPLQSVFEECRNLSNLHFRFKEKSSPIYTVLTVASDLQSYPMQDVLSGPILMEEFRPDLITELLNYLTPDNMRLSVVGKKFEGKTNLKEKWYQADYSIEDIDEAKLSKWRSPELNEKLHAPEKNEFLPENLDLVEREKNENKLPMLIRNTRTMRAWFQQDNEYLLPKAFFGFEFNSPLCLVDPLFKTATSIFISLINDKLNEYKYAAELVGIVQKFERQNSGFSLEISGYNDKLIHLINKVFDEIIKLEFNQERFNIIKEIVYRDLRNYQTQPLRNLLVMNTTRLLAEFNIFYDDLIKTESQLTYEKMLELIKIILGNSYIEIFAHGNLRSEDVIKIIEDIEMKINQNFNRYSLTSKQLIQNREFCLDKHNKYIYNNVNNIHEDNGLLIYYQIGQQSMLENGKLSLLNQILAEPCFNRLRTNEQLGYIVGSSIRRSCGVQGLRILVQSERNVDFLEERVEQFLIWAKDYLNELSIEEFEKEKQAIIVKLKEKPKKLLHLSSQHWQEILSKHYNFERRELEVAEIEKLSKQDILDFFMKYIAADAPYRRKLCIGIESYKRVKPGNDMKSTGDVDEKVTAFIVL